MTLVDRNIHIAKQNAEKILKQAPKIVRPIIIATGQPVQAFLNSAVGEWDLVFMDPPYEMGLPELVHNLESLAHKLLPGAVVVLERSSRTPVPEWPAGIQLDKRKDYGDTTLYWLTVDEAWLATVVPGGSGTARGAVVPGGVAAAGVTSNGAPQTDAN